MPAYLAGYYWSPGGCLCGVENVRFSALFQQQHHACVALLTANKTQLVLGLIAGKPAISTELGPRHTLTNRYNIDAITTDVY